MGGGGSATGRTDFPNYMKIYHSSMLNGGFADSELVMPILFDTSIAEALNSAAAGTSPYFAYTSGQLEPDRMFFTEETGVYSAAYAKPFDLLKAVHEFDFDGEISSRMVSTGNDAWVSSVMAAQSAALDDEITIRATPKLHARMREIGAVMSSAFVIGDTLLEDSKIKALASTRLQLEQLALSREELAIKGVSVIADFKKLSAIVAMDFVKMYYAISSEVNDTNAEMLAKDKLWDLKLFQYAANPLGSISGSALQMDHGKGSKAGTAVGGAIAGAASGAMMGASAGPYGAAIGGVLGAVAGLAGGMSSH